MNRRIQQRREAKSGGAWRRWLCLFAACTLFSAPSAAADASKPALPILVYHQIRTGQDAPPDGMTVIGADRFAAEMAWLHDQHYATLSMEETVAFLKGQKFPGKVVAIHFDDGWASAAAALPVLERYGFKATFWIVGTYVGSGALFMDWPALQALEKNPNYRLYSHTMTHPIEAGNTLADWAEDRTPGKGIADVWTELAESKKLLEEKFGHPVPYLDWPSGIFNNQLVALAEKAGYTALVTTTDTPNHPGDDPLFIHRTMINGACGLDVFQQIVADGKYRACP